MYTSRSQQIQFLVLSLPLPNSVTLGMFHSSLYFVSTSMSEHSNKCYLIELLWDFITSSSVPSSWVLIIYRGHFSSRKIFLQTLMFEKPVLRFHNWVFRFLPLISWLTLWHPKSTKHSQKKARDLFFLMYVFWFCLRCLSKAFKIMMIVTYCI